MADVLLTDMVKAFLQPASKPRTFKFTVPKSHPKAEKVMRLFKMLANREIRESGLVVERQEIPGADLEIIEALRELDIDVDEIKSHFPKNPVQTSAQTGVQATAPQLGQFLQHAGTMLPLLKTLGVFPPKA